ncbi:unnamed protein product [Aphanomyces euteiches]|nr:hypothetical protein Ae201684P_003422 [Aphanomyces euteiches]
MKTVAIFVSFAVATTSIQGAKCTIDDWNPALQALSKCTQNGQAGTIITNPGASADAIANLCKIDDCKKAFDTLANLPCEYIDESSRKNFKCDGSHPASSSIPTIVSGVAVVMASVLTLCI